MGGGATATATARMERYRAPPLPPRSGELIHPTAALRELAEAGERRGQRWPGGSAHGGSSASGTSSTAALVKDLSAKLARQRKQLEELVAQRAATASSTRWYHVALLTMANNLLAIFAGFCAGSFFFQVGPFGSGSFEAEFIRADALQVRSAGPLVATLEPSSGGATLNLQAGADYAAQIILAGDAGGEYACHSDTLCIEAVNKSDFVILQAAQPRVRLRSSDGSNNTDLLLTPLPGGALSIDGDLSLSHDTIRTRNSTLTLLGGPQHNVRLEPAGGALHVRSGLDINGSLLIRDAETPLLAAHQDNRTVVIGADTQNVRLAVSGSVALRDKLLIMGTGLNLTDGDVLLGSADIVTKGNVQCYSSVTLGSSMENTVSVSGMLTVSATPSDRRASLLRVNTGGDMNIAGSLTVAENVELKGDVVLGSQPSHTVTINAFQTEMNSLVASSDVVLGDDGSDTTTVYGAFKMANSIGDSVLEIDPLTGNTAVQATLTVMHNSWFRGSAILANAADDLVTVHGSTVVDGSTTMRGALYVQGNTHVDDMFASNVSLSGFLKLRDAANTVTFSVNPESGNIQSMGSLFVGGQSHFEGSILIGNSVSDQVTFNGAVQIESSLQVDADAHFEGYTMWDGDLEVLQAVSTGAALRADGDVMIGSGPHDAIVLNGSLIMLDGPHSLFSVEQESGNVLTQGTLTAHNVASFDDSVVIDKNINVLGHAVFGSQLNAFGDVVVHGGKNVTIGGGMRLSRRLHLKDLLSVHGDVWLGSRNVSSIIMRGGFSVQNSSKGVQFSTAAQTGDTYIAGSLAVGGALTCADSVTLGTSPSHLARVHLPAVFRRTVSATQDLSLYGRLDVLGQDASEIGLAHGTLGSGNLRVRGDAVFGSGISKSARINADINMSNTAGDTNFFVNSRSGDVLAKGPLQIRGNIDVRGHISIENFHVREVLTDRISAYKQCAQELSCTIDTELFSNITYGNSSSFEHSNSSARMPNCGLLVEGVLFENGRVDISKAHNIHGKTDELGVNIAGVQLRDGAMKLASEHMGESPASEHVDLLTLVNTGHAVSMAHRLTPVKFRQTFGESVDYLSVVDSSSISAGTACDWTPNTTTHNSYLVFHTANNDVSAMPTERMRISAYGDIFLNSDQVIFRAKSGDTEVDGNVQIGNQPGPSQLLVHSEIDAAIVQIHSGGQTDGRLMFVNLLDGVGTAHESIFDIRNEGSPPVNVITGLPNPVLHIGDATDDLISLVDTGTTSLLKVSGAVEVGSQSLSTRQQLVVQSGADAELFIKSGQDTDAVLEIKSGPGRKARLALIDPAEDGDGCTFSILNDGGDMRIVDTDDNQLLSIVDRGHTGDLAVTGDGVFGSDQAPGDRTLTVQANVDATMAVMAGSADDGIFAITSGPDASAILSLVDSAPGPNRSIFNLYNDGAEQNWPTLRITNTGAQQMLSLEDNGDVGMLAVTGGGLIGGPDTFDSQILKVETSSSALVEVKSGGSSDAHAVLTSGANEDTKIVLSCPVRSIGSTFEMISVGMSALPKLQLTDSDNELIHISDAGERGDLVVNGHGHLGGEGAAGPRALKIQSSEQSQMRVISGPGHSSTVHVQSGGSHDAKLVLLDPGGMGINTSQFELSVVGSEALPTLRITDGLATLVNIVDAGGTGNLQLTGSALLGSSYIMEDRTLVIESNSTAQLKAISSLADATITLTSGANQHARLILSDMVVPDGTGSSFEIVHAGTSDLVDNSTLRFIDGTHTMMDVIDRGNVGDLLVTGSFGIGNSNSTGPRSLTVQSKLQSSLQIISGNTSDAYITVTSGYEMDAKLVMADGYSGTGPAFELFNDGSENEFSTLRLTDGSDASTLLSVKDKGNTADLVVTGAATVGGPGSNTCGLSLGGYHSRWHTCNGACVPSTASLVCSRSVDIRSLAQSSVSVHADNDAEVLIKSGPNKHASLVLGDAGGVAPSYFELYNDGSTVQGTPTLSFTDGTGRLLSLHSSGADGATLLSLVDATFSSGQAGDNIRELTVLSGGSAALNIESGKSSSAELRLQAGPNLDSRLLFDDPDESISVFELVNIGNTTNGAGDTPMLVLSDGKNRIVSISAAENYAESEGNIKISGTLQCEGFSTGGTAVFGTGPEDYITLKGHIAQSEIVLDTNDDGHALVLHVEDPVGTSQTITFPDETGTVLTNASSLSSLTSVGSLRDGSISTGFGSIVIANDLTTSGAVTASTATIIGDCVAKDDVYLGDDATDETLFRGLLTSDLTMGFDSKEPFGPEIDLGNGETTQWERDKAHRLVFENEYTSDASKKATLLAARFNPTTIDSPPGERNIDIPDIPNGGTLHISSVAFGKAATVQCTTPTCPTNVQGKSPLPAGQVIEVNGVLMDSAAGVIESSTASLQPHFEEQIFMKNRRIVPGTVVVANIADFGGNGAMHVQAVHVSQSTQSVTFVMRNVHPTQPTSLPYRISWALFN